METPSFAYNITSSVDDLFPVASFLYSPHVKDGFLFKSGFDWYE